MGMTLHGPEDDIHIWSLLPDPKIGGVRNSNSLGIFTNDACPNSLLIAYHGIIRLQIYTGLFLQGALEPVGYIA